MTPQIVKPLLERVADGTLSVEDAFAELRRVGFADLGFARVDVHRRGRNGFPEMIYGEGKTAEQVIEISRALLAAGQDLLVTRLDADKAAALSAAVEGVRYNRTARIARREASGQRGAGRGAAGGIALPDGVFVAVVAAGTSDLPVVEEAVETLDFLGVPVRRFTDVGVAGIHRLLADSDTIAKAAVAIVVAGMEGALPSVVGGLVDFPLIAVPTSVGYGANFAGLSALLAMMNSCATGVTVVNIDNGFGAAVAASQILRTASRIAAGRPR